jgi:tRNA 5-methylaminomethyl-2-thiouridine biosynthesis bifunctional protein
LSKTVAIIGAGLAGAACANAFALAGFNVTVFERGAAPASGASGVPLAMFAPSVSSDDAPHSRLLRRGVHILLKELHQLTAAGLLTEGKDWALTGVLERCIRGDKKLPSTWLQPQDPPGLQSRVLAKSSSESPSELFHGAAGWVNTARLINAWLAHPAITIQTQAQLEGLDDARLRLMDRVVVACGYQTPVLVTSLKTTLQPIRGQTEWGFAMGSEPPVNGMGHWMKGSGLWLAGATFQRDEWDMAARLKDTHLNFEKLSVLRPELSKPELARLCAASKPWVGVRVVQKNRSPLMAQLSATQHSQVWVCTALGSRGLSLAALCAQQLLSQMKQ